MEEAKFYGSIITGVWAIFVILFSFFLYATRDKLREFRKDQDGQNREINDLKSKVMLMENIMVTDKALTAHLNEFKREVKEDIGELSKNMNEHRQESSDKLSNLSNLVTKLIVIMDKGDTNGNP